MPTHKALAALFLTSLLFRAPARAQAAENKDLAFTCTLTESLGSSFNKATHNYGKQKQTTLKFEYVKDQDNSVDYKPELTNKFAIELGANNVGTVEAPILSVSVTIHDQMSGTENLLWLNVPKAASDRARGSLINSYTRANNDAISVICGTDG